MACALLVGNAMTNNTKSKDLETVSLHELDSTSGGLFGSEDIYKERERLWNQCHGLPEGDAKKKACDQFGWAMQDKIYRLTHPRP